MRTFKDLLLTAVAVIAFLAVFEVGLRLAGVRYDYSLWEADAVLYSKFRANAEGWEIKEGENVVRINSHGMRDRERSFAAAPETTRLALLGDSFVAAVQVPLEKTMAQVLERRLTSTIGGPYHSVEVLNFAQAGGTLGQQYLMLRDRVWPFQPQIVLVFVSPVSVPTTSRQLNTLSGPKPFFLIRDGQVVSDPQNRPPAASLEVQRRHAMLTNLMNRYRLLLLLHQATSEGLDRMTEWVHALPRGFSAVPNNASAPHRIYPVDIWFGPPSDPEVERAWQVAEGLLRLMAEDTHRHGAEFWLVSIGTEIQESPNALDRTSYAEAHGYTRLTSYSEDRFEMFAKGQRIPYIRLVPGMREYAERNNVSVRGFFNTSPNRGHWNEYGNAAAAGIIADALREGSDVLGRVGPTPR
jgi:hypothetical protein